MEHQAVDSHIAAVVYAFGLGSLRSDPHEIARGEIARVFRAETSTGIWALKLYLTPIAVTGSVQLEEKTLDGS